jgi:hypothetical protein
VTVVERLALPSPSYTMCVEQEWVGDHGTGAVARGFGLGASPAKGWTRTSAEGASIRIAMDEVGRTVKVPKLLWYTLCP